jgi:tetratricopeptide (TPR) repeat protein/predicted Ser/Thr protein kinase
MIGQTISHYRIIETIGEGGMGVVYKAQDEKLKRTVALKFLSAGLVGSGAGKTRFVNEAQSAAALEHPNICTIYEIDEKDGRTFIAMAYIKGRELREIIAEGPMKLDAALDVAIQVAQGLQEAHDKGIIHRDIKSANVIVTDKGRAMIMDFGLAKQTGQTAMTREGTAVGTIAYMSPEQAQGRQVDHRTDIWSFGVLLYEMIVGRHPFPSDFDQGVVHAIIKVHPEPVTAVRTGVPMEIERIITKCLAKRPEERYQNMGDLIIDLRAAARELASPARSASAQAMTTAPGGLPGESLAGNLWDRRVPQIVTIYLVLGFGLVQVLRFLVNRFPLSPHIPDFSLVAIASLIPTVVLLTYFRGKGGRASWSRVERIGIPVNLLVSAFLLFVVFQGKDLGAATTKVSVNDEEGKSIERVIPKAEFRKRIALFYFDNASGDPAYDWLQYGIVWLLRNDIDQDRYVTYGLGFTRPLRQKGYNDPTQAPLTLKRQLAGDAHLPYFFAGTVAIDGDRLTIRTALYDSKKGNAVASRTYNGTNVFTLVDSMSIDLRRDLGIPAYHLEESPDLPVSEIVTQSTEALQLYVEGRKAIAEQNDFAKGAAALEGAVEIDPTFALAHWFLYSAYAGLNRGEEALNAAQTAMQHRYRLPETLQFQLKGDYYEARAEVDEEFENAKRWAALYPDDWRPHNELAGHYERLNQLDAAIEERKLALEMDPEGYEQLRSIGSLYEKKGEFAEALGYYEQYAEKFPDQYQVFTDIARLYRLTGDYEKARASLKQALVIDPDRMEIRTWLAEIDRNTGNFPAALQQCREALAGASTPEDSSTVLLALLQYHAFRGETIQALELFHRWLTSAERFIPPVNLLFTKLFSAGLFVSAGQTEAAFDMIRDIEAQQSIPELKRFVDVGYLMVYSTMDDSTQVDVYDTKLAGFESYVNDMQLEMVRWAVHACRAMSQEWRGQFTEALQSAQKALEIMPQGQTEQTSWLRCGAARYCRELGRFEQGLTFAQEILATEPFNPMAHYEVARIYYEMGRKDEAVNHLNKALYVWENADPPYKPAQQARALAAEWRTAGLNVQ